MTKLVLAAGFALIGFITWTIILAIFKPTVDQIPYIVGAFSFITTLFLK